MDTFWFMFDLVGLICGLICAAYVPLFLGVIIVAVSAWIRDNKPIWDWEKAARRHWDIYLDGNKVNADDVDWFMYEVCYDKKQKTVKLTSFEKFIPGISKEKD